MIINEFNLRFLNQKKWNSMKVLNFKGSHHWITSYTKIKVFYSSDACLAHESHSINVDFTSSCRAYINRHISCTKHRAWRMRAVDQCGSHMSWWSSYQSDYSRAPSIISKVCDFFLLFPFVPTCSGAPCITHLAHKFYCTLFEFVQKLTMSWFLSKSMIIINQQHA